jgi:prevent-host-death family protein
MIARSSKTVGAYEAKTRLPALLQQVARGQEIVITLRNRPIARIVPLQADREDEPDASFFRRLRAFRERHVLPKGETTRDLVQAGRRI